MAWEETGEIAAGDLREGERVKGSITGEITCIHNGGVRIDAVEPKGRTYAVWLYPGQPGVSVERVEDIRHGDVYQDACNYFYLRASDRWYTFGLSEGVSDHTPQRPLTLIYRPEASS